MWLDQELRDHGNIALDGDTAARRALASDSNKRPEVLYYLAEDPDAEVRRCIAENDQTLRQANMPLAQDDNEEVRCVLAKKIGRLFPRTSATKCDVIRRTVMDITEILAADQKKRVRELFSDAIKEQPDIPQHVVRQLAANPHLNVCGSILEYSPALTDEDWHAPLVNRPVLQREDRLTEKQLRDAAAAGNRAMVIATLAAASGLPCKAIQNIFEMRARKGIVAVCWKAGLSMNLAY